MRNVGKSALWLLHYWWPLALGWSLVVVVARATGRACDPYGAATLLSGILAAYSLDRIIDRSSADRSQLQPLLIVTCIVGVIVCGASIAHLPLQTAALVPVLGTASLLYPRLKRFAIVKAALLPGIWIWAVLALPFNDGSWLGWHALLGPVAVPLLLLNAAGCILCDLKDESRDRRAGVRTVPTMYGAAATARIAGGLAVVAAALAVFEHRPGIVLGATALGIASTTPSLLAIDAVGPLLVDVILTLPGILISTHVV